MHCLFYRYKDGKPITSEEFEKYKIILESEDNEIGDGLKECTFSLTIPRCTAKIYSLKILLTNYL